MSFGSRIRNLVWHREKWIMNCWSPTSRHFCLLPMVMVEYRFGQDLSKIRPLCAASLFLMPTWREHTLWPCLQRLRLHHIILLYAISYEGQYQTVTFWKQPPSWLHVFHGLLVLKSWSNRTREIRNSTSQCLSNKIPHLVHPWIKAVYPPLSRA